MNKLNKSILLLCDTDDISMSLWTGQISAFEQYFLTIASFLALKQYRSADSTIPIGLQRSCNTAEITRTQTPCKKVIICQTSCTIYSWLFLQFTHSHRILYGYRSLDETENQIWNGLKMSLVNKKQIMHVMCKSKAEASEHTYCTPPKHVDNEITDRSILNICFPFPSKKHIKL